MAVVGALASVAGGAAGMMQANYQAKVAEMNAKIAKDNERLANVRGGIEAQMQDVAAGQLQAEQLTGQAASGVTLSGDSQILTRNQAKWFAAADRNRIRENANYESYGYKVDAANFKAQAQASRMSGIASMVGGVLSGIGGLAESGIGTSLMGKATGTSASTTSVPKPPPKPTTPIPIPRPKPVMPVIGRSGNVYNPLTRKKLGYV